MATPIFVRKACKSMTDMEKRLADALKPFTFRTTNLNGSPRHDPWTDSPSRVSNAAVCDCDVMAARKAYDECIGDD